MDHVFNVLLKHKMYNVWIIKFVMKTFVFVKMTNVIKKKKDMFVKLNIVRPQIV